LFLVVTTAAIVANTPLAARQKLTPLKWPYLAWLPEAPSAPLESHLLWNGVSTAEASGTKAHGWTHVHLRTVLSIGLQGSDGAIVTDFENRWEPLEET